MKRLNLYGMAGLLMLIAASVAAQNEPLVDHGDSITTKRTYISVIRLDADGAYPLTVSLAAAPGKAKPVMLARVFKVDANERRTEVFKYRITLNGNRNQTTEAIALEAGKYEFRVDVERAEFMYVLNRPAQ